MSNFEKIEHTLANGETVMLNAAPIPEGTYKMMVKTLEVGSSKSGDEMVKITFGFANGDEAFDKKKIYGNYLTEYSKPLKNPKFNPAEIGKSSLDKLLKAVGVKEGYDSLDEDLSKLKSLLVGESFIALVKDDKKPYVKPDGSTYLNSHIAAFQSK